MPHNAQGVPGELHAPDRPTAADAAGSRDAEVSSMCEVCLPVPATMTKAEAGIVVLKQSSHGSARKSKVPEWQAFLNVGACDEAADESCSDPGSSASATSQPPDEESISEDEAFMSVLEVCVEKHKYWTSVEDETLAKIGALARELREKPLLPAHPQDPLKPWLDTTSGIALPVCHCAFLGCTWVSPRSPCRAAPASGSIWQGAESCWIEVPSRRLDESGAYACCGEASCLREHLVVAHAAVLQKTCGVEDFTLDCYDYYLEAIAVQERQSMPKVGCSVDRRTFQHVRQDMSEEAVKAVICMCCQCISTTSNGNTKTGYINAFQYFNDKMMRPASYEWNWDFQKYRQRYVIPGGTSNPLHNHPELADNCWNWRRVLPASGVHPQRVILCCPEDIRCARQHQRAHVLCDQCEIPLCRSCFFTSQQRDAYGIPEAMANDNFSGYVTDVIYKYKVRWIEAAAACPVFTALITYYVEGDRGHLMNEQMHRPQRAYAVRGNAFSFHMPWEKIMEQLGRVLEEDHLDALPHPPEVLSSMVIFSLRIGDVTDLDKYLPQARLRPHVVLKLCLALLDSGYPFKESAQILRKRFAELVSLRYPEKEAHLPEDQRQGTIPPEIEKSIRDSLRPIPGEREKGIKQKHATPAEAPRVTAEALEELRPSSCFPDRESFNVAPRDSQELVAMRKHYLLEAATDVELISQWNSNYFA